MDTPISTQDTNSDNTSNASNTPRPTITPDRLKEFIYFIVQNLVTQKDQVDVSVDEDMPGSLTVHIKVGSDDKGRVIGRNGSTINSIRTLVRVFGRIVVIVQD